MSQHDERLIPFNPWYSIYKHASSYSTNSSIFLNNLHLRTYFPTVRGKDWAVNRDGQLFNYFLIHLVCCRWIIAGAHRTRAFLAMIKDTWMWPAGGTKIMVRSKTDLTSSRTKKTKRRSECCQSRSTHKAKPTVQHGEDKWPVFSVRLAGQRGDFKSDRPGAWWGEWCPLGVCKVSLEQSEGNSLFFLSLFLHNCHRPQRSPEVPLSPFSVIFPFKDVEWGSSAGHCRMVISSHKENSAGF